MKIITAKLLPCKLTLKHPFRSAHDTTFHRQITIVALQSSSGAWGYGELEAFDQPTYTPEFQTAARGFIQASLIPRLRDQQFTTPEAVQTLFADFQGNQMAKAAVETAIWDLFAKEENKSLAALLTKKSGFSSRLSVPVGISIGASTDANILLTAVKKAIRDGYQRIKVKVTTTTELNQFLTIRKQFPQIKFMIDGNSAFSRQNFDALSQLTTADIVMLEQPFATTDFIDHAWLQHQVPFRICLDENIFSLDDVKTAYQLGSCRAINLKLSRVGGLTTALQIIHFCHRHHLLVWCGGMLEGGVGRATNLALASLTPLTFPGDISASSRYYHTDIITESFNLTANGRLTLPSQAGIGVHLTPRLLSDLAQQPNLL